MNQLRVGLFLALGLAAVAATVVYFGRLGEGIRSSYNIRVEYSNASGLLKGSSVLLAGAKIGAVTTPPTILPDMAGVYVTLRIYEEVQIPNTAQFSIGSSGLLGDRFVVITLDEKSRDAPPIEPNAVMKGKSEGGGLGELTDGAGELMQDIRDAVKKISEVVEKIDSQVLSEDAVADFKATVENLERTTASFAEFSGQLDGLVADAQKTMATGDETLLSAKEAAEEMKQALADVRTLLAQAKKGRGALGTLLTDKEVSDNLKALVVNLKRHGILWYRDSAAGRNPSR